MKTFHTLEEMMEHIENYHAPWYKRLEYKVKSPYKKALLYYNQIRWSIQRARRGYSDYDLWGFDIYLAGVLTKALTDLKSGHGYPTEVGSFPEWCEILDEMILGFKSYAIIMDVEKYMTPEWTQANEDLNRGLDLFKEHYMSLWD